MDEIKKEEELKKKLLQEVSIGHSIQQFIFPKKLPRLSQFDIGVTVFPASELSGDFYDLFLHPTPEGKRLFIAIGDASGKGIEACLYALLLRSMLRSFATTGASLQIIIEEANQLFCLDTKEEGMFATVWTGILDIEDNSLHYASLGHYPALLKKMDGEIVELKTNGKAFGFSFTEPIVTQTIGLKKDDLLFLYTDGWFETHFNSTQLNHWLHTLPLHLSSTEILASLNTAALAGESKTQDDRTALALRLK